MKTFTLTCGKRPKGAYSISWTCSFREMRLLFKKPGLQQGDSWELGQSRIIVSSSDGGFGNRILSPNEREAVARLRGMADTVRNYNERMLQLYGLSEREFYQILVSPDVEKYRDFTNRLYSKMVVNYGNFKAKHVEVFTVFYSTDKNGNDGRYSFPYMYSG